MVRIWDADTGPPVGDPRQGHTGWVTGVAYSPDGRRFFSSSNDGTVRVWYRGLTRPVRPRRRRAQRAFSPDGHRIVSGGEDKTVRLWDADTGLPIGQPMIGHTDAVTSVAFSPDGHRIVSASKDHTVRLWDAETGQPIGQPLVGHTDMGDQCGVQPRRPPHRVRQPRQDGAAVERQHRANRSASR